MGLLFGSGVEGCYLRDFEFRVSGPQSHNCRAYNRSLNTKQCDFGVVLLELQ